MLTAPLTRVNPATIVLRLVCAVVLAVGAVLGLGWVGRDASVDFLLDDAQHGRMSTVVATSDEVLWHTDGAARPWRVTLPVSIDGQTYETSSLERLLDRYVPEDAPRVDQRSSPLPSWMGQAMAVASIAGFLLLVAGPVPWRANRWAWFWFITPGRGAGIGMLLFLLLSGPTPGIRPPRPDAERWSGLKGFGYSLLLAIALSIGWYFARRVFWPARTGVPSVIRPAG